MCMEEKVCARKDLLKSASSSPPINLHTFCQKGGSLSIGKRIGGMRRFSRLEKNWNTSVKVKMKIRGSRKNFRIRPVKPKPYSF